MQEFKADSSFGQVFRNGIFTVAQFAVYTLSGIILTPFLLRRFGAEAYGLIALAGFLTQYVGMIAGCVGTSVSRFLNIALNQNNWQDAAEIFSTAIVGNIVIVVLQLPLFALGVWKLHWLIDFPPERALDFKVLVSSNIGIFLITIFAGLISAPIYAANRLDMSARVNVLTQFMRLLLLFGLIIWLGERLWIIGAVDVFLALIGVFISFHIYRQLAKPLVFQLASVNRKWFKPVLGMAGFTLISSLANSLFFRTDIWMLNRFVDSGLAGIYAALLVWPNFVSQLVSRLTQIVGPTYFIDYARGDTKRILRNTLLAEKMIAYCVIMATVFFVFFGDVLLRKWLGRAPTETERILLNLFFVNASLAFCADAVWRIFQVYNRPKLPGYVALACGVLNVVLSLLLIYLGKGIYGVVAGTLVSSFLLKSLFQPWYAAHLLKERAITLWYPIIISFAMCLLAMGVKRILDYLGFDLWFVPLGYLVICGSTMLFALSSREDRVLILGMVKKYVSIR